MESEAFCYMKKCELDHLLLHCERQKSFMAWKSAKWGKQSPRDMKILQYIGSSNDHRTPFLVELKTTVHIVLLNGSRHSSRTAFVVYEIIYNG
nr:hypothetical protein CFP56_69610 [Quercus suber]